MNDFGGLDWNRRKTGFLSDNIWVYKTSGRRHLQDKATMSRNAKEACDKVVMKEKYRRVDSALLELAMYRAKSTLTYISSWIYGLLDFY